MIGQLSRPLGSRGPSIYTADRTSCSAWLRCAKQGLTSKTKRRGHENTSARFSVWSGLRLALATNENKPGYAKGGVGTGKRDIARICPARRLVCLPGVQSQGQ